MVENVKALHVIWNVVYPWIKRQCHLFSTGGGGALDRIGSLKGIVNLK